MEQIDEAIAASDRKGRVEWNNPFDVAQVLRAHFASFEEALPWIEESIFADSAGDIECAWGAAQFPRNALQAAVDLSTDTWTHPELKLVARAGNPRRLAFITFWLQHRVWETKPMPLAVKAIGKAMGVDKSQISTYLRKLTQIHWLVECPRPPNDRRNHYLCPHALLSTSEVRK